MKEETAVQTRTTLRRLTDRQLVNVLSTLAVFERRAIARLVAAIAEFDERKLYLPLGFTSLFAYCTHRLGLSQDETFHRIAAARIVRRYPIALEYLERNALTLTTLGLLGPHLTADNHVRMLDTASHQKKPEVEMLIARLKPKPDVPSTIRKLPAASPLKSSAPEPHAVNAGVSDVSEVGRPDAVNAGMSDAPELHRHAKVPAPPHPSAHPAAPSLPSPYPATANPLLWNQSPAPLRTADSAGGDPAISNPGVSNPHVSNPGGANPGGANPGGASQGGASPLVLDASATILVAADTVDRPRDIPSRRPIVAPLSEASYRLQITMSKATYDRLREIQSLMRHVIPNGDPAAIVDRSFQLLLESLKTRRAGAAAGLPLQPTWRGAAAPAGRYLPVHIRRAVWTRDEARCAFVSADGTRCGSSDFLEFHHVRPYAKGGKATVRNIQLRCRAHNAHEAEVEFGKRATTRGRG